MIHTQYFGVYGSWKRPLHVLHKTMHLYRAHFGPYTAVQHDMCFIHSSFVQYSLHPHLLHAGTHTSHSKPGRSPVEGLIFPNLGCHVRVCVCVYVLLVTAQTKNKL